MPTNNEKESYIKLFEFLSTHSVADFEGLVFHKDNKVELVFRQKEGDKT